MGEELLAAAKAALRFIAMNTPMCESSTEIMGPIGDECDRVRGMLRSAIAACEAAPGPPAKPGPATERVLDWLREFDMPLIGDDETVYLIDPFENDYPILAGEIRAFLAEHGRGEKEGG